MAGWLIIIYTLTGGRMEAVVLKGFLLIGHILCVLQVHRTLWIICGQQKIRIEFTWPFPHLHLSIFLTSSEVRIWIKQKRIKQELNLQMEWWRTRQCEWGEWLLKRIIRTSLLPSTENYRDNSISEFWIKCGRRLIGRLFTAVRVHRRDMQLPALTNLITLHRDWADWHIDQHRVQSRQKRIDRRKEWVSGWERVIGEERPTRI